MPAFLSSRVSIAQCACGTKETKAENKKTFMLGSYYVSYSCKKSKGNMRNIHHQK
jgi:hypothetical protein